MLCDEHHICRDNDEFRVGDRVVQPFGLGLGIFKVIDVLRDALAIEVIAVYLVL